jgi:nucleoside-triphosphatase
MAPPHALLIAGVPGVGKTTLLLRVASSLAERGTARYSGFTTEEIRAGGRRQGFRIVPLSGPGRIMSHVDFRVPNRVGRYGVDVSAVDAIAETSLALDPDVSLYLVDEIGKMECLSERFVRATRTLLDARKRVVATVALRGSGFIAEVKRRPDVLLREVTLQNRDSLLESILAWIGSERSLRRRVPASGPD